MSFAVCRLMIETQRLWREYCRNDRGFVEYRHTANALERLTGRYVCQGEIR